MSRSASGRKIGGVQLRPAESVLAVGRPAILAVWPKYLLTLGLYSIWRQRETAVLTDQRIVMGKGVISRREVSIPLARIDDAAYVRRGLAAYCEVGSNGGGRHHVARLGPIRSSAARRFTSEIQARI